MSRVGEAWFENDPNPLDGIEVAPDGRGYDYDPIGNRETSTDWNTVTEAQQTTAYTPNSLNQYASLTVGTGSPVPFTYDLDGNLATLEGRNYTYDGENRLVEYAPAAPAEGDKKLAFLYDYLGRRVKRETYAYGSGQWTKTEERRYVYDGWNLAQELDGTNTLVRSYVWGLDLSQTLQGAGGVGGLLASVEETTIHHYCYDANGNVGQLVKATDGTVAAHYEYDPFGSTTWSSGPMADANPFRFSTKYQDPVSGLYYYGYRYYAPILGRWVNRDPIGEEGGNNLYDFARNDGVNNVDRDGRIVAAAPAAALITLGLVTLCAAAEAWANSPEGQRAIQDIIAAATSLADAVAEGLAEAARRCDRCSTRNGGCLPCDPQVGSVAYRVDFPPSPPHGNIPTPHSHMFVMLQSPPEAGCVCRWYETPKDPLPGVFSPEITPASGGGVAP